jgi:hypothetical protein
VVPALIDVGVVGAGERIEVSAPEAGRAHRSGPSRANPPPRGVTVIRPGAVRSAAPHQVGDDSPVGSAHPRAHEDAPAPGPAQVHVHIDRIEVLRAALPPAPPATPRRGPPRVDHAAYLERRRADRR